MQQKKKRHFCFNQSFPAKNSRVGPTAKWARLIGLDGSQGSWSGLAEKGSNTNTNKSGNTNLNTSNNKNLMHLPQYAELGPRLMVWTVCSMNL